MAGEPALAADCSELLGTPEVLVSRFAQTGICFVRDLVPRPALEALRDALVELLVSGGVAERPPLASAPPLPAETPVVVDVELYRRVFALPLLHSLAHEQPLLELMALLVGTSELFVHPRPACRIVLPSSRAAVLPTPPHQDHLGMQGSPGALTAWIPLVDCPPLAGPIAVAEGSHLLGRRPFRAVTGARVLPCEASDLAGRWVTADFRVGDVMVFHCMSVHQALPNRSDGIRLSVDYRCQAADEPVCELTVRDDPSQSWDDLYAALPASSPALSWRQLPLQLVPFDATVLRPG